MSKRILNFQEVKEQILKAKKRHLLLGNGFSMAYDSKRFSFTSLYESAIEKGFINKNSYMNKVFDVFKTKDFEEVIRLLETSVNVLKSYEALNSAKEKEILNDANLLKKHLVDIITNNHPEKITEIADNEFLNSVNFIKDFDRVYTLNYDLLLYWTCIKLKDFQDSGKISDITLIINDGFSNEEDKNDEYVVFANDSRIKQNTFFLHGGLHIFDRKNEIIKNTYNRTDIPLKKQTLDNLNKNIYPVFVSEGTSEQKKSKIIHNAYLNHCYKSLSTISGSLVIFGTMLKRGDGHIREAILKSNTEKIYIGISNEKYIAEFDSFMEKCEQSKKQKEVFFYDYKTVKVWR